MGIIAYVRCHMLRQWRATKNLLHYRARIARSRSRLVNSVRAVYTWNGGGGGTKREAIKEMCPRDQKNVRKTILKCDGCVNVCVCVCSYRTEKKIYLKR